MLFHYVPDTGTAPCCYDTIVSESRIAAYIGIAKGEVPERVHFGPYRSFPDTCDWSWTETRPVGFTRTYYGTSVYDGSLEYNDTRVTPSWGGSMFEALMPALFLPEERWGPGSWGANHPLTVAAQIHHGMVRPATATGASRPPTTPKAATGRTASTGSAATRMAIRRTTTARSSTTAGRAARTGPRSGSAAERVHQRRRDAARGLPGAALRAGGGAREPGTAGARLQGLYALGLPRLGQRRERRRCRSRTCRSTRA